MPVTSNVGNASEREAQLVTELIVPSLQEAVRFLVSVGFVLERESDSFAALRWDQAYLFVAEDRAAEVTTRWTNIRVIVPDADAVRETVRNLGHRVVREIADRSYGLRDFAIRGPAGIEIRFAQILK